MGASKTVYYLDATITAKAKQNGNLTEAEFQTITGRVRGGDNEGIITRKQQEKVSGKGQANRGDKGKREVGRETVQPTK